MKERINKGDRVAWQLGHRLLKGQVIDMYIHSMGRELASAYSNTTTLDGDSRALLIELEDGRKVLKLESEVNLEK